MDPRTDARTEQEVRDALADVRGRVVDELRAGDVLTTREILGNSFGGVLLGIALLLVLAGLDVPDGEDRSWPAVAVGVVVLGLAWLALRPWLRRQAALWRSVRGLSREVQSLKASLPEGADDGPGVLRLYYARRFGPLMIVLFALMGLLLVVRLSR